MIYHIVWDNDDARFDFYDNTYWHSLDAAYAAIHQKANDNYEKLQQVWQECDSDIPTFSDWVDYCIQWFLYEEEIQTED